MGQYEVVEDIYDPVQNVHNHIGIRRCTTSEEAERYIKEWSENYPNRTFFMQSV